MRAMLAGNRRWIKGAAGAPPDVVNYQTTKLLVGPNNRCSGRYAASSRISVMTRSNCRSVLHTVTRLQNGA